MCKENVSVLQEMIGVYARGSEGQKRRMGSCVCALYPAGMPEPRLKT